MRLVIFGRENDSYFEEAKRLVSLFACDNGNDLRFQDVDLVFGYSYELGIIVGKEASDVLSNRLSPALKRRSVCLCRENEYADGSYTHQLKCINSEMLMVLRELLDAFCGNILIPIEPGDFLNAVAKDSYCIVSEGTVESISYDDYRNSNPNDKLTVLLMSGCFDYLANVKKLYNRIAKDNDPAWGYRFSIEDTVNILTIWSRRS